MMDGLRRLPRVDRVVADPSLEEARRAIGGSAVTAIARTVIAEARQAVVDGGRPPTVGDVAAKVSALVCARTRSRTRRVINATGVVLHTNLGRAPLAHAAVEALSETAAAYVALELDLDTGTRGGRAAFAEQALAHLAGAEAALVVNNNAAAVLLALTGLAHGKGVVVSRGELVEIGGGFRIPEVLARSGARLIEVGTTNKTRVEDYTRALQEESGVAALLRVHPGNFRQTGFVERPTLGALAEVAHERGITLVEDLGGGLLVSMQDRGVDGEPLVGASITAGADIVCFSTDKVLGGPQGGALVGRKGLIERLRRDPLARALRIGRLPLVALEATLGPLLRGDTAQVPALAALRKPLADVRARAGSWDVDLRARGVVCEVVDLDAVAGGGAFAEATLASAGVALEGEPEGLLARLRAGVVPVIARIEKGRVVIDARTVLPGEDEALLDVVAQAARGGIR